MVKYRSRLVRGYGKDTGYFDKKGGSWLNLWLIVSTIFSFLFLLLAQYDREMNLIVAIIGLLGLVSIFTTPMLFFIVLGRGSLSYGVPDLSSIIAKKIKKNRPKEPLEGYEDCSPQFQDYMREEIKRRKEPQELLIEELKRQPFKTKNEKKAFIRELAKKRVDQLKRKKQKPSD